MKILKLRSKYNFKKIAKYLKSLYQKRVFERDVKRELICRSYRKFQRTQVFKQNLKKK